MPLTAADIISTPESGSAVLPSEDTWQRWESDDSDFENLAGKHTVAVYGHISIGCTHAFPWTACVHPWIGIASFLGGLQSPHALKQLLRNHDGARQFYGAWYSILSIGRAAGNGLSRYMCRVPNCLFRRVPGQQKCPLCLERDPESEDDPEESESESESVASMSEEPSSDNADQHSESGADEADAEQHGTGAGPAESVSDAEKLLMADGEGPPAKKQRARKPVAGETSGLDKGRLQEEKHRQDKENKPPAKKQRVNKLSAGQMNGQDKGRSQEGKHG